MRKFKIEISKYLEGFFDSDIFFANSPMPTLVPMIGLFLSQHMVGKIPFMGVVEKLSVRLRPSEESEARKRKILGTHLDIHKKERKN